MNQLLMSVLSQKKSVPKPSVNYVRFVSASSRTITPKYDNSGVTLQYSVDGGATWITIASESETTSATEHCFRGQATGTKSLFISNSDMNAWEFSGSSDLEVYGNLNFLLCDTLGDMEAPTSLANYCYTAMFSGCTSLVIAPKLPATTLANYCYTAVFSGCTSLVIAPKLPATTLANYCYRDMFSGCTSLVTAPGLPATTLANFCYYSMFNNCTSLISAPGLPATTLADYCYRDMFNSCTSLISTPELPATTLGKDCYSGMFSGCTSLTSVPKLPATTLRGGCYTAMFRGCISLVTVPELPATTLTSSCYRGMFSGCISFKVSQTKTSIYKYPWRIPTSGTATTASSWGLGMLDGTGGTFTYYPARNTTYYVENQPV